MSDERATVRPVTLARLVECAYFCRDTQRTTEGLEEKLEISHRRARSTILEALRIGLLAEDDDTYETTSVGDSFIECIQRQDWTAVSEILETRSPHYGTFLTVVDEHGPAKLETVLSELESAAEFSPYSYNQASVDVLGDWGERLGTVQRNAFSGEYYRPERSELSVDFVHVLLTVYDELEETAGVGMRQRYLSIPEVRETICARLRATREAFDEALGALAKENVGKLELSGAPRDTSAKEAQYGIKEISRADDDGLISTSQSTEKVMAGIDQFGKQYYYLTIHDRDLTPPDR